MALLNWLIPINGPALAPLELKGPQHGLTIGRNEVCNVCLPGNAEGVSRKHAMLRLEGSQWLLADLNSSWGTFLNGSKLSPDTEVPLAENDLIGIGPWTLKLSAEPQRRSLKSHDDVEHSIISSPSNQNFRPLAESLLKLLLNGATTIYAAKTEVELAQQIVAVAQAGTGLGQAVVLRPIDAAGGIEIIANSVAASDARGPQVFSRSLIAAAARGSVAELCQSAGQDYGNSIAQLNITCAICVPLMLGESPAAFLYLDSRGGRTQTLPPQASAFCAALGTMGSLALANLKRMDLEKREAIIRADLNAAAVAQKWIMPQRSGVFGKFTTLGESRPGHFVGGDFFDLIELEDGRLAVSLGDVSGKGVAASVLMTAAQGYLHSAIARCGEPGQALTELNDFIMPRRPADRFLTMWVGVFDLDRGTIQYVDAGHGYALKKRGGQITPLNEGSGMPIGVAELQYTAETAELACDDQVIIVSDGFIEQTSQSETREEFGLTGVEKAISHVDGGDSVAALFNALISHAGSTRLADDATAVLVRCCG